jgi:hypothetical protein
LNVKSNNDICKKVYYYILLPMKCDKQSKSANSGNLHCDKCRILRQEIKSNPNKKTPREIELEFQALLKPIIQLDKKMIELMEKHVEEEKNKIVQSN